MDNYESTPLHIACKDGDLDLVKLLIDEGADLSAVDGIGSTPLHITCTFSIMHVIKPDIFLEIAKFLIEKGFEGAIPSVARSHVSSIDYKQNTPLHYAINNIKLVKLLLEAGADVSATNRKGYTPLHKASDFDNTEIVKLLIDGGADVSSTTNYGSTSLHIACDSGNVEMIKLLLDRGADISKPDGNDNGYTPLHIACNDENMEVIELLLNEGAEMSVVDNNGYTPLHNAYMLGCIKVIKILVEEGADISSIDDDKHKIFNCVTVDDKIEIEEYIATINIGIKPVKR